MLKKFFEVCVFILALVWACFQLFVNTFPVLDSMSLRAVHLLFLSLLVFLTYPTFKTKKEEFSAKQSTTIWQTIGASYTVLCACAAAFSLLYLLFMYKSIVYRGGFLLPFEYVVATMGLFAFFEMARRVVKNLAFLAALFVLYALFGDALPLPFGHAGLTWDRLAEHLFWGTQGIFGLGLGVSATYLFVFMLLASFLKHSGFSFFINDLCLGLVGRQAGGPAKVSVLASAFMGMLNGSAIANVATTGAITIPLMKRAGYPSAFAAAVEAVASTGGQFAPPVMGAVGFIMAEFLGVPYSEVMLAAAIPAFLYYLTLIFSVHFEAKKLGLQGMNQEEIPSVRSVLVERGHLLAPLFVLCLAFYLGYTPLYAANFAILATVLASFLRKSTRMSMRAIVQALYEGAMLCLVVGVACMIIGVIIGVVSLTALALNVGYEVVSLAEGGFVYIGALLVMGMSLVLGMGVPGLAAYVIVATVAAPLLVELGASPLASHMFCLFYACLSNITPPVAMSSYIAAGLAQADELKTSLLAMKLGAAGFIVPLFFIGNPVLLFGTDCSSLVSPLSFLAQFWALLSASLGVIALASALQAWFFGPLSWLLRLLLLLASFLAIDGNISTDIAAFCLIFYIFYQQKRRG